jgi:hypothetical protein
MEPCGRAPDVALVPIDDVASIESIWRDVVARADHSFFLSWPWIGTWLRHLPKKSAPHLLTAMVCGLPWWSAAARPDPWRCVRVRAGF